jgi:ubiquinone/menaquinone biosynthesis C-methylase UbiE
MQDYIHGSTDLREVARLEKQARFCAPWFLPSFDAAPGMRVLDLGTGIGAMAEELMRRFPAISLTALDRSAAQLAVARERHPVAAYVRGDAAQLPFADAVFDRVHATWLLEHVPNPEAVVREVLRVLKPHGVVLFLEVDNATLTSDPPLTAVNEIMAALDATQVRAGGDPYIGRKLAAVCKKVGFSTVQATSHVLRGNHEDPVFFRTFVDEFAEIFESVDEALGADTHELITRAATELRALPEATGSSLSYSPVIVRAER